MKLLAILTAILDNPRRLRAVQLGLFAALALALTASCIATRPSPSQRPSEAPTAQAVIAFNSGRQAAQEFAEAYVAGNVEGAVALSAPHVAEDLREGPTVDPTLKIVESATIVRDGPTQQDYLVKFNHFGMKLTVAIADGEWQVQDVVQQ